MSSDPITVGEETVSRIRGWVTLPSPAVGAVSLQSAVIAGLLAVGATVWVGVSAGHPLVVLLGLLSGSALAMAIAGLTQAQPLRLLVSGMLLLTSVGAIVGVAAVSGIRGDTAPAILTIGSGLVGFGVVRFRLDAYGGGAATQAIAWTLRIGIVGTVLAIVVGAALLDISEAAQFIASVTPLPPLTEPSQTESQTVGFVVSAWLAAAGLGVFVFALPSAEVLPDRRQTRYQSLRSVVLYAGGGGLVAGSLLAAFIFNLIGPTSGGLGGAIQSIITSPQLRVGLLRVFNLTLVGAVLLWAGRIVGARVIGRRPAWVLSGGVISGSVLITAGVAAGPVKKLVVEQSVVGSSVLRPVISLIGTPTLIIGGFVTGIAGVSVLVMIFPLLAGVRLIPPEHAGSRFTFFGSVVAILGGTIGDASALTVLAAGIVGIVAWDIADHGRTITTAIGETPAQQDGELSHAVGGLAVGGGAIVVTGGLYWIVTATQAATQNLLAPVLVGTTVVILLIVQLR